MGFSICSSFLKKPPPIQYVNSVLRKLICNQIIVLLQLWKPEY